MLTSCSLLALCGIPPYPYPSLPCTAVGPVNGIGRPVCSMNVCMWLGTFIRTRQTCKLQFFFTFYLPRGDSLLCQTSNYLLSSPDSSLSEDMQTKHNSAASLLCQWAKGGPAGNDRTMELRCFLFPSYNFWHVCVFFFQDVIYWWMRAKMVCQQFL